MNVKPTMIARSERHLGVWAVGGMLLFALLTAVGAELRVPLPGTPVPVTLQSLFVLIAALALGGRWGSASMAFYLLLGVTGYHVFALGQAALWGPSAGYLLGFVAAPIVINAILSIDGTRRASRVGLARILAALVVGHLVIFAFGVAGLTLMALALRPIDEALVSAVLVGVLPFLPGMVLKTLVALAVARPLLRLRDRLIVG